LLKVETLILGAGAAGLHCAAFAGQRGATLVVDHAKRAGEKIRISGGGRCNFTNIHTSPANFISQNPHFAKSALARYRPQDFVELVSRHGLSFHEKTLGQLFCDQKSPAIIQMLLDELHKAGAELWLETQVLSAEKDGTGFAVELVRGRETVQVRAENLVVATGGKSIPKMGATGLGYELAQQFGLGLVETYAGLVPFTFTGEAKDRMAARSGVSTHARVSCGSARFDEGLLFTHRGLSGPSLLQVSSYWSLGQPLLIDFCPGADSAAKLKKAKAQTPSKTLGQVLAEDVPQAVLSFAVDEAALREPLQSIKDRELETLAQQIHECALRPAGTEGYRTAEVTVGGVDTASLSSRSMAAKHDPNLYFIGEVVDVTGWLGGYNFQWAWSSAAAAGRDIISKESYGVT